MRYAKVRFGRNTYTYEYLTVLHNLQKGDQVLLDSSTGLGVGKFMGYTAKNLPQTKYSWILCKLDIDVLREGLNESRTR